MKAQFKIILASLLFVSVLIPGFVLAYSINDIDKGTNDDVLITPAKVELSLNQGEVKNFKITISNRLNKDANFKVSVADILPSSDNEEVLKIKETELSDSVNFIKPEINSFVLKSGQAITLPVFVSIPFTASSGGYSFGILVTASTNDPNAPTVLKSRLGVVTLLKVGKDINEKGELKKFTTKNSTHVFFGGDIETFASFENSGDVHLNPYGQVSVTNMFGKKIETNEIRPWFVLRTQTRTISLPKISTDWKFGKYSILLELNRGYQNVIDRQSISVFIFSWQWLVVILLAVLMFIAIWLRAKKMSKDGGGRGTLFYIYMMILLLALVLLIVYNAHAEVASSTNYLLERDSINIGGDLSTSTNYITEDTVGEAGSGRSTSATYILNAGYQQLDQATIAISSPANVDLSPAISPTLGGQSNGSATWLVTTSNVNGYSLSIKASQSPAMRQISGSDSFADYTTTGVDPDYDWQVSTSSYEFGYSPNGNDLSSRWQNDGSACNTGIFVTDLKCWDGHTTSNVLIATSGTENYPTGATTTVNFRAESNGGAPSSGGYQATLILTAVAL